MTNRNPHNKPTGENYYAYLHEAILASAKQRADTLPLILDEVCLACEDTTLAQALHAALKRRFPNVDNPPRLPQGTTRTTRRRHRRIHRTHRQITTKDSKGSYTTTTDLTPVGPAQLPFSTLESNRDHVKTQTSPRTSHQGKHPDGAPREKREYFPLATNALPYPTYPINHAHQNQNPAYTNDPSLTADPQDFWALNHRNTQQSPRG